jgi:O-antigen ligase
VIPRRVRWATGLAFMLQGVFILTARYRLSYDAYNHMFFGDHYRLDWWTLWEPRWYTGFEITSYPPLVHQSIGLLGRLIGVDAAFALLLWAVLTAYPLAVYAFGRVFAGKTVAGYAALCAAVLPSIYQAAHTFGQLPTLTSGLFALFGLAALNEFLHEGRLLSGALTVALFTVVMAAHHATLLFLPWIIAALLIHLALNEKLNWTVVLFRLALVGGLAALGALLVIWPFWVWGRAQTMQTPIDHPSRHNFFLDPFAPVAFFLPVYGPLIPLIPVLLWKGFRRRTLGLWTAFLFLFILGLGGTTPLPRWLFGSGWEWLTYDRFALWASLTLLPWVGEAIVVTRRKISFFSRCRRQTVPLALVTLGFFACVSGLLPTLLPTQPPQIDMEPIVRFLAQEVRSQWRYVTFGLGDQLAYLSRLTQATTLDGSYHTARNLPELRESGIGQIDTTYWLPDGLSRLDPILQKAGERGVRWGFVNRAEYLPILRRNGWVYLSTLENQIQVWENPQAGLPPPVQPPAESPFKEFSWGVFPLSALALAGALALLRLKPVSGQKILFGVHALAVGLLPLGLCFWYYRTLFVIEHPGVYFTYDSPLLFLSDALALVAVLAWALARRFGPAAQHTSSAGPLQFQPAAWFFGLCLLASLSSLWSPDWRTSLWASLQLWLVFGLFLSLQDRRKTWRAFAIGGCAALLFQIWVGFWEFGNQTTAFLTPLGLNWPGELLPSIQGASVVQLVHGERWLRAYGTLPHPNLLGGLGLVFLGVLTLLSLKSQRPPRWRLLLFALGVTLLVLTFSRSAWLGFAAFGLALGVLARRLDRKRLFLLALVTAVSLASAAIPLRELIFTRAGSAQVSTETFSTSARTYLAEQGLAFFREQPLTGVGMGAFILQLADRTSAGYLIEPVHNVPLLVTSELGLGGALLLLGLAGTILLRSRGADQPEAVVLTALLAGLFVISLFDHYLWSLAPGRMLLGGVLGLWAGQTKLHRP